MEALATFSNPSNLSAVSLRERVPPCADTMEACGGHVLKLKQQNSRRKSCVHTVCVVSSNCPEDSAVQFDWKQKY